jgi:hypothetical protein
MANKKNLWIMLVRVLTFRLIISSCKTGDDDNGNNNGNNRNFSGVQLYNSDGTTASITGNISQVLQIYNSQDGFGGRDRNIGTITNGKMNFNLMTDFSSDHKDCLLRKTVQL